MTNTKVILFNGPPSSGKDFAAKHVTSKIATARLDKFARILKERTHALYGYPWKAWDYYEDCKDEPNSDFLGLTPRQAYIGVSENYFKVMHNKRVFGELLAKDLDSYEFDLLVISDSGFREEAEVLIEKYGASNTFLVKISSPGTTFEKDSRDYVNLNDLGVTEFMVANYKDDDFTKEVEEIVDSILNPITMKPDIIDSNKNEDVYQQEQLFVSENFWDEAVKQAEKDARPPVQADTVFVYEITEQEDYTEEGEDYVFSDLLQKPSLLTRVKRVIGLG